MTDWSFESRLMIVRGVAAQEQVPLPDDVAREIALVVVTDSIREVAGAVIRLIAYASLTGEPLSVPLAQDLLWKVYGPATESVSSADTAIDPGDDLPF